MRGSWIADSFDRVDISPRKSEANFEIGLEVFRPGLRAREAEAREDWVFFGTLHRFTMHNYLLVGAARVSREVEERLAGFDQTRQTARNFGYFVALATYVILVESVPAAS